MSKNLIYMVAIDHSSSKYKNSDYSQYSINSWKSWCKINNVDFKVVAEHDERLGKPIWNKELIFERSAGYDKIGIVDSDTMIKWDSPNPFDLYDDEFCGIIDNANLKWIYDSANNYGRFFPNLKIEFSKYINAGVLFFSNKHLILFEDIFNFYIKNKDILDNWDLGGGKEQTILNYHLLSRDFKRKYLDPSWNLFAIHKKEMFIHNWQLQEDMTSFFIKYGNIWHFTGFGIEDRINIMKQVWEKFGDRYK